MATTININGRRIVLPDGAGSISVTNGVLFVDGREWLDEAGQKHDEGKILKIELTGDLVALTCDRSVTVSGGVGGDVKAGGSVTVGNDVNGNVEATGSVSCRAVGGSVDAQGSVNCGTVGKDLKAGGSVTCGSVGGNVKAGGSIVRM